MLTRSRYHDNGFTLIELLVVMIIIGVLAAVAIPIFLNQQKTARDTQTISDVKNLATQIHTAMVNCPNANVVELTTLGLGEISPLGHKQEVKYDDWVVDPSNAMVLIYKSPWPSTEVCKVNNFRMSPGTTMIIDRTGVLGVTTIYGYNPGGKKYMGAEFTTVEEMIAAKTEGKVVAYELNGGGLKR